MKDYLNVEKKVSSSGDSTKKSENFSCKQRVWDESLMRNAFRMFLSRIKKENDS